MSPGFVRFPQAVAIVRKLVRTQDIIDGNYHIHWLEHFLANGGMEP